MSHEARQRGAHPEDELLFSDAHVPTLRLALHDYCWLLSRGYAVPSSLKLVGDRYRLVERQRLVLMRAACRDAQRAERLRTQWSDTAVAGCDLYLDGLNVLITIESALSGGFVFVGQDGCYRDLASVHGTYKQVQQTCDAITLIGVTLAAMQVRKTIWLLDRPVSNSGRLRQILTEIAEQNGWQWQVDLCQSPDVELKKVDGIVVSTDSVILDSAKQWFHLNQQVVDQHVPDVRLIDLRSPNSSV